MARSFLTSNEARMETTSLSGEAWEQAPGNLVSRGRSFCARGGLPFFEVKPLRIGNMAIRARALRHQEFTRGQLNPKLFAPATIRPRAIRPRNKSRHGQFTSGQFAPKNSPPGNGNLLQRPHPDGLRADTPSPPKRMGKKSSLKPCDKQFSLAIILSSKLGMRLC